MSFTTAPFSLQAARLCVMVGLILAMVTVQSTAEAVHAFDHETAVAESDIRSTPEGQEHEDRDPETNLPYLFAVFIITWAVFFGYVFVMSGRQREMRREIEELRKAMAEREESRPE